MNQYVIKFSKQGYICYTSHLDLLRLFKRSFKKAGVKLSHSQGFNPHPKLGFAQPLSLGYSSITEYLEFETVDKWNTSILKSLIEEQMPEGIEIHECVEYDEKKSMAARCVEAEYIIGIPMGKPLEQEPAEVLEAFLAQEEIMVPKRQKKSKKMKDVNIREKIRVLNAVIVEGDTMILTAILDSGSESNLSPELLIQALTKFMGIETDRAEMNVMRTKLSFE